MTFNLPNPETRTWAQPNSSDLFGVVAQSRNIDFDKLGYLSLAKRSRSIYDSTQDEDFGQVTAIAYWMRQQGSTDEYYIVTNSGKGFILDGSTFTMTKDANTYVPTFDNLGRSDLQIWGSRLYASAEDGLHRYVGSSFFPGAWIEGALGTAANGGGGPLCVFVNKNGLAWGDGNTVKLYTGTYPSESLSVTLTLPDAYWVTSLAWSNNYLYVGTRHRYNCEAHLFVWDGADTTWNNSFSVGTHRIDSVVAYQDSVAVITSEGQLMKFNGGGFSVLGNLPIYYKDLDWDVLGGGGAFNARTPRVLHRGMVVEGDLIFVNLSGLINNSTNDSNAPRYLADFPSGVWCYDPEVGLYHRHSFSGSLRTVTDAVTTANVNTGTGLITVAGATVPATGTPVLYDDGSTGTGTALAPLEFREKYFVIRVSDTTMRLATTRENAVAGTAITLTGTGNDLQYFVFLSNRDFGGVASSSGGAICLLRKGNDPGPLRSDGFRVIFGGYAGATTTELISVLNVAAEKQENRGHFTTAKVLSTKIVDDFMNLTVRYAGLGTDEDAIRVKFRVVGREDELQRENTNHEKTATWVDENTFTTTADLDTAEVGDEVEFSRGSGAGYIAHIVSLTDNSGTWTVVIDEDVQNITAGDTALFYVGNWQLLGEITSASNRVFTTKNSDTYTSEGGAVTFVVNEKGEWIQFKIELRGEDVSIYDILINNKTFSDFTK